jgi:hypothetical protein
VRKASVALWWLGGVLLCFVLGALTVKWVAADRVTPPEGWTPMVLAVVGLLGGVRWPERRGLLWSVGWLGLLAVLGVLIRVYVDHPNMTIPALYYATFVGTAAVAGSCTIDLCAARPADPTVSP